MPYAIHDGRVIFFAHVPKAAGSSVEAHMEARYGPLAMLDPDWNGGVHRRQGIARTSLQTSPQHVTAFDAEQLLPQMPRVSFAVVRDPVARIASEYRFQFQHGVFSKRTRRTSFSLWLRSVLAACQTDPTVFDNHIRPQSDIVPEDAKVFRLEDGLEAVSVWLDEVSGAGDWPPIGRTLTTEEEPLRVTKGDAEAIARFYATDYERFGYSAPEGGDASGWPEPVLGAVGWAAGKGLAWVRRGSDRF